MKRLRKQPMDATTDLPDFDDFRSDDLSEYLAIPTRTTPENSMIALTASTIAAFPIGLSASDVSEASAIAGTQTAGIGHTLEATNGLTTLALTTAFPNGVSAGDVTQTSAVVWTRAVEIGEVTFQIATDASFGHKVKTERVIVSDPLVPVKAEFEHLHPGQTYFYRVIDASGDTVTGSFETAAELGVHNGFHFAVVADQNSDKAPFPAIKNAVAANLDLVIKLGDTVYADIPPPPATTLAEFRLEQDAVYSNHHGFNFLTALQANAPVLSMIDDHEVIDNFAGGAPPSSDPRFAGQPGDFINETPLFANGVRAFTEYNAIEDRTYSGTGDDRFDGAPDLYRYQTYGSDAAIIMVDARSFRDAELSAPVNPLSPTQVSQFLTASFDPSRTMLGDVQLERLEQDLLDARDHGVTWKFIMVPEPIQNFGPIGEPGDRFEGYAAERNALLKFIEENHIENTVFVSSDMHWTSVNNLTYQDHLGGPQIASSAFEVITLAAAATPFAPLLPLVAFQLGLINAAQLTFYNSLPNAPDTDSLPNDKDDFVKQLLNGYMTQPALGYDPIGLESNSKIHATLLQGDYFVGHDLGWTDFNIDPATGTLRVTTWGIPAYTAAELAADPAAIISRNPTIVSQFEVTPTSNSIVGSDQSDHLTGTDGADVMLGADGNDLIEGRGGNDYLDGGKGNDRVVGSDGGDRIFGRDGNDALQGEDGNDQIDGGAGNDRIEGGAGDDIVIAGIGNDQLTGGPGNDTIVFNAQFGMDTITDFVAAGAAHDVIQFSKSVFADWTALEAAITDGPQGAVITVDPHNVITILGVPAAQLVANHVDDFNFV